MAKILSPILVRIGFDWVIIRCQRLIRRGALAGRIPLRIAGFCCVLVVLLCVSRQGIKHPQSIQTTVSMGLEFIDRRKPGQQPAN